MSSSHKEVSTCKNVLLITPYRVVMGGIETFLLNLVRSVPKEKYRFIWYCQGIGDKVLAREFEAEGVCIIEAAHSPVGVSRLKKDFVKAKDFWKLCRSYKFNIVHVHTPRRRFQAYSILLSWLCGIPCRIAHGHNYIPNDDPTLKCRLYQYIIAHFSSKTAACSSLAARHLFGPRYMDRAVIFPNGIDTVHFAFSSEIRQTVRKSMGLNNMLVFGHAGRFREQKNHPFLIEVFRLLVEKNDPARPLLAGDGPRIEEIKDLVRSYGLTEKVIFTGNTNRISEYLCAMDVFLLPSLYEGLGIVNLEAQAAGLSCVVSDRVAPEAKIAEDLSFLPLEAGPVFWAERLLTVSPKPDAERMNAWQKVRDAGYDLRDMGRYAEQLYS